MNLGEELLERWREKINPEPNSGCWLWIGTITEDGYGRFWWRGRHRSAHRLAVMLAGREIPQHMQVDHKCRVRCCVNPDHLEVVTQQTNIARGRVGLKTAAAKRLITHCPQGHPYDARNTGFMRGARRHRRCLACHRAREHARYHGRGK